MTTFIPLIVAVVIAVFVSQAAAGDIRCPAPPLKSGPDFSLPCILHSPIPETDDVVYFGSGSFVLSKDAKAILDRQAEILLQIPNLMIETIGFVDIAEAPADSEKAELGRKRAAVVREYLIGKGIDAGRVTASGRDYAPIIPRRQNEETLAAMRYVRTIVRE
ncbi:MAG: hypothetical protein A3G18_11820 [Rhodospirillales bacterium RIFCSPLOWO2_12_FULL_58_28]|nr:MAG: hypothetical protein A3H92_12010 [Rhodospirillales bacterium RIFCSPLOWO2_02_FULL_58_16]OHC77504.1 MAG: hypothetical protein A3G18_11820 [Rhodospirillales bacterium RIFCSPLOWO2_12_FULL_58_28]